MKRIYFLLSILAAPSLLFGQTDCSSSLSVVTDPAVGTQYCLTNAPLTDATLNTPGCFTGALYEGWYSFTITSGPSSVTVSAGGYTSNGNGGGARDIGFQVFQGGTCTGGTLTGATSLGCINATGNGGTETQTLTNLANGTYYIAAYSLNNGTIPDADICVTGIDNPPANDDCANAIPLAVGTNGICVEVTGTNAGATASGVAAPSCGGYLGGDVWYSITVPASGEVTFGTDYAATGSLTDLDMAIYSGTCGSLTEIACDDFSGTGVMPNISATGLTPGSTVYIRVWEYGNDISGEFDLCISEPPASDANQDCITSTPLCSDQTISGASNGTGAVTDIDGTNQGCLSVEHQTSWFTLQASTAGTFAFTLSPSNGVDDYDFAVWHYPGGSGQTCPPSSAPDRCSFGAGAGLNSSYDTGLGQGATDQTEGAAGDNWVQEINLAVGDVIVLLIDNFSSTTSPYSLDFTGTAGLDCTILPTQLTSFTGTKTANDNVLNWNTVSEINNDYFSIEVSNDAQNWTLLSKVNGAGTTELESRYTYTHVNVQEEVLYYRLSQTDYNGIVSKYKTISVDRNKSTSPIKTVNLLGQDIDENYRGVVIDIYEDGSTVKYIRQ